MAEVAFNIAEQVITKLGSVAFQEIELISGAKDDLKKLENSLTTIKAVLIDAEEKQEKSLAVKSWLRRLQDIVYEADELVDEVATNDMQRMVQAQSQGKVVTQLVYNDEKVKNYFEKKMWVCVSEDFDVKLLVKKILECATDEEVPNLELEQLHNRLKEKLGEKRYLLVLDDVWNEDKEKWDGLKDYLSVGAPGSKILVTTRSTRVTLVMGVDFSYILQGLTENEAWDLFEKLAFGRGMVQ
ncbi:hypothetical protein GH714_034458 [Hevea brasiliensis]|uniref:Rx N-terminal domain-containing protein n=1 Tax=Hevea brasiliensis TaxID=3981 RepID=A0A6A6NA88_HEVBR|nr:hypothetical protein GH714_034458 [Hevea brasiliensis]